MNRSLPDHAVAIIGIGCRLPGGGDTPAQFWKLLCDGVDAIRELPEDRFDADDVFDPDPSVPGKIYSRWGGFLDRVDAFDADFFGISPREARRMDPQHRLLLEVVWEAIEDGGQLPERLAGTDTGVFIGISSHDYGDLHMRPGFRNVLDAHVNIGNALCAAANRISYLLDLRGPSLAIETACSSSLTAVHLACRSLRTGESDLAIVGGVNLVLSAEPTIGFCKASMISPDGRCRAFDASANGYVRSEGAGVVVLKPLEQALRDGDPVYAVIRGTAVNEDGRTAGISLPNGEAQERLLRQTLQEAGVAASSIRYVEAHGTGTAAGDPIEAGALGRVFGAGRSPDDPCLIGSAKTNVGHLEAAAGITGLIKATLVLKHRTIPPNLHFREANPAIPLEELRLRVPTRVEPLPNTLEPARVGVNAFGFGGANAHVILEESPRADGEFLHPEHDRASHSANDRVSDPEHVEPHLLATSARTAEALRAMAERYVHILRVDPDRSVADVCYTACRRRSHHEHRLAVVGRDSLEFVDHLEAFLNGDERADVLTGRAPRGREPKLVFAFSGMGPQWWGMGRQLLAEEPVFRDVMEACDGSLRPYAGWSLLEELGKSETDSRIDRTDLAHVANCALQVALAALWRSRGVLPDAVVGHSSGEIAAACVAGALTLDDALFLAYHRGRLQHQLSGTGGMLAAAVSAEEAAGEIAPFADRVSLAAVNGPSSVTLSGDLDALEQIDEALTRRERFCRLLRVAVPYHAPQMIDIRDDLLEVLDGLKPRTAGVPMASSVTGEWLDGSELDAEFWWRNVREPVRFAAAVDRLLDDGCDAFVEIGPHPVLAAYLSECLAARDRTALVLPTLRRMESERTIMLRSLAALHTAGRTVDWSGRYPSGTCVPLPTYAWQRERYWLETLPSEPAARSGIDSGHPLLGRRLHGPYPTWEMDLDDGRSAILDDHVVQGSVVFPGAGYVEMMLAAAGRLQTDELVTLEGVEFRKLLFLQSPRAYVLQLHHRSADAGLEVYGAPRDDHSTWTLHAVAKTSHDGTPSEADRLDLETLRDRCPNEMAIEDHFHQMEELGFRYGPAFRGIEEIWYGEDEAIASIAFPDGVNLTTDPFRVHPALLDAAFQIVGVAVTRNRDRARPAGPLFPVGIDRVTFRRPAGARFHAHVDVRGGADDFRVRGVRLADETGAVVAAFEGLQMKLLDEHAVTSRGDALDWLYELQWQEASIEQPARTTPPGELPDVQEAVGQPGTTMPPRRLSDVRATIEAERTRPEETREIMRYLSTVRPSFERAAAGYALQALERLGWDPRRDLDWPADEVADRLGVVRGHRRLFSAIIDMASSPGRSSSSSSSPSSGSSSDSSSATPSAPGSSSAGSSSASPSSPGSSSGDPSSAIPSSFASSSNGAATDVPRDQAAVHRLLDEVVSACPAFRWEADLLRRGGDHLSDVLTGRVDAREVLLSGEAMEALYRMYHDSPGQRTYHDLLAPTVAAVVGDYDGSTPLRVLEIGAGTGSTTSAVLPILPEPTQYVFTDVSRYFLAQAEAQFGDHPGIRFAVLDIEQDPSTQGFEPYTYDLVLAANVLHATADLRTTLKNVRRLLAPGGMLGLLEVEERATWLNLVFGLLEGWWRFRDADLRPDRPILDARRWRSLLEANGFEDAVSLFETGTESPALQSVVLARAGADVGERAAPEADLRDWVLLADRGGAGERIAAALRRRGDRCVLLYEGERYAPAGQDAYETSPDDVEALSGVLGEFCDETDRPTAVVHLWSLDAPAGDDVAGTEILAFQQRSCAGVLNLLRALERQDASLPPIWFVTAGSQAVEGHGPAVHVAQAALWGLGRVLMSEHADARCRLVDLGPDCAMDEVDALVHELERETPEDELAFRGAKRFVRRLERVTVDSLRVPVVRRRLSPESDAFELRIGTPGALDTLALHERPAVEPGPGEVAIRVMASGLNFMEVLQALGLMPAEAPETQGLGVECAGVVAACGEGVEDVQPGDEVIALASPAHGSRAVAPAHLVVPKPANLSFAEAATVVNAFVTAEYALNHAARVAPGERVLIHSATGAVGLAVIQLCRRIGAEVFASAGTPEKRAFLLEQGVEHVMDSRSLSFADAVRRRTNGEGVDVVVNSLTGEAMQASLELLRPYGRFVELGKRDVHRNAHLGLLPFRKNLTYTAVDLIQLALDRPAFARELLGRVIRRIADGEWTPPPHTAFDLAGAEEAFRLMAQARHVGKVVLTVDQPDYDVISRRDLPLARPNATYLITGGLGGFGLAAGEWLVRRGARQLVLMSRSGVAKDDGLLERLRASGATVDVMQGDVGIEEDVTRVLSFIRRERPSLAGVIHAAMVLDDDALLKLDEERFRSVLSPKVAGAWNLHRLTLHEELDFFLLFSSIASVLGHPMQANYAAANAFLDSFGSYRRSLGLPGQAVGWGAVADVGYVARHPELARFLERSGFASFAPEEAFETLEALIRRDVPHVIAARIDWRTWAEGNPVSGSSRRFLPLVSTTDGTEAARRDGAPDAPLARLRRAHPDERAELIEAYLLQKVARVLGSTPEKVDPERPLTETGFDSLMAVELTTAFKTDFGLKLPVVKILQGISTRELVPVLLNHLRFDESAPDPESGQLGGDESTSKPTPDQLGGDESTSKPTPDQLGTDESTADPPAIHLRAGESSHDPEPHRTSAREGRERYPLSFEQQRFWLLDRLNPGNPAFNMHGAARLRGRLDVEALERSVSEVARRHEVLRAVIEDADGEPAQRFMSPEPLSLPLVDLSDRPPEERDAEVARRATGELRRPFRLDRERPMRAVLFRLSATEHVFLFVVHHVACDAWSMNMLVREVATLYEDFSNGKPSSLPPPPFRYVEYVLDQRRRLEDDRLARQRAYWKEKLAGVPPALRLPPLRDPSRTAHASGGHFSFEWPVDLSDAVQQLTAEEGATLFQTLLAAFQVLVRRYTGEDDFCVGTAVSARGKPGSDAVAGCFMNTLALRSDLVGDPTFRELLRRARQTSLEALDHQDVPFDRVVEAVRPERGGLRPERGGLRPEREGVRQERDAVQPEQAVIRPERSGRSTLFRTMLVLHNARLPALSIQGLELEPIEVESGAAVADVVLIMRPGRQLSGTLEYDTSVLDAESAARMTGHLQRILESAARDPDTLVSRLPLLDDEERVRLLETWNDTDADFGQDGTLHELVEAQVELTPDAVAVVSEHGELTYRELNLRADRLAGRLRAVGAGRDAVVGLCSGVAPESITGMLGVLKSGAAFLPLDPADPPDRLGFIVRDAGIRIILTRRELRNRLPDHDAHVILLDDEPADALVEGRVPAGSAEDLAYVIYTSGSTGSPKGVMIPHRAIRNQVCARRKAFPLSAEDTVLMRTPPGFDPSIWEVFGPLLSGARIVVPARDAGRDVAGLVRTIIEHDVSVVQVVPALLDLLVDEPEVAGCRVLRHVFCGGEPLTARLRDRFFDRMPGAALHNLYGPAETAIDATSWTCRKGESEPIPIGTPIANVRAYVLDDHLQPVPVGIPGELCIGGAGLARGYLNRPELTAERFVSNPFADVPGERIYRTGDRVRRRPDGVLEFLGRLDDQLKVRGMRIEPREIEHALTSHTAVREAAVTVREDASGDRRLVANVVVSDDRGEAVDLRGHFAGANPRTDREGTNPQTDFRTSDLRTNLAYTDLQPDLAYAELRRHLATQLPGYMVPTEIAIVDAIPRLPSGKVDRRSLAARPRPVPELRPGFVAPRDDVESELARIWEDLLETRPVGITDDFFDLGGYSLLAMRLASRIRGAFGLELPLSALVDAGTIESLAPLVRRQLPADRSCIVPLQPHGDETPFFCVHPSSGSILCYVELARAMGRDRPFYAIRMPGVEDCVESPVVDGALEEPQVGDGPEAPTLGGSHEAPVSDGELESSAVGHTRDRPECGDSVEPDGGAPGAAASGDDAWFPAGDEAWFSAGDEAWFSAAEDGMERSIRIEEVAERYARAVREVQPTGPYVLGGWSMGAVIAYEMACRLQKEGEEVSTLVLLDPPSAVADGSGLAGRLQIFLEELGLPAERIVAAPEFGRLNSDEQLARILEEARRAGIVFTKAEHARLRRSFNVHAAHAAALRAYRPSAFSGRIALFRPEEVADAMEDWDGDEPFAYGETAIAFGEELVASSDETVASDQPFAFGEVVRRTVPGNHYTMLHKPAVRELAHRLSAEIRLSRTAAARVDSALSGDG